MKAFFLLLLFCLGALIEIEASTALSPTTNPATSSSQMLHGPYTWSILILAGVLAYLFRLH